ncbi:dihydrolipoamide acetyltransferase family protein [Aquisalinus flavus]|uniref:Dihydrolipoamide acetyltransferase component of pyruvate dehydrogenase complex n=1 Tax=Aquisalinus flavus TaxID=1526572 RepID=A0A8J2V592_9PROT|nr:dihydrolipoamide acetyltransferase family protein [Aquisalinus flavus]MBD0425214.1 2-oxo acid dehydrogenase subunit E2 [Aquisalinus flavus]UNE49125.1 2-oxo acid dehydrogenase subunit E2 [Aquisalinus flavus]GGD17818.1 dihydrolipoamide acetyltransferase component of pyruvate dehydrogenase complex [Aquisalinus flavus]
MGVHVIKLPDVGEGVAEAEFVELHVKNGDEVQADQTLADVMTDKATVEIPAPVAGKVIWIGPEIGETIAVGTEIFRLEVAGAGNSKEPVEAPAGAKAEPQEMEEPKAAKEPAPKAEKASEPEREEKPAPESAKQAAASPAKSGASVNAQRPNGAVRKPNEKPLASPAVRKSAQDQGIDLRFVHGTSPAGRITHDDLDAYAAGNAPGIEARSSGYQPNTSIEEIKVIGLRRKIAQKMQEAKRRIPHASYIDEIDMTALEELRQHMNAARKSDQPKLTLLPFLMRAIVMSVRDFPQVNARYDDENDIVQRYGAAHIGIATQTDTGLIVPVVRHAEANDLWTNANEIRRLSDAARDGTARREELSGSTITITSLGAIGGIASTPVINAPEVAIIGVNKMVTRPMYNAQGQIEPRKLMNLSSSFDHRVVDGWDMAQFIQTIKAYLEFPATMFMD